MTNRIGDIYRVWLDNGNQRFFQYIARDKSQLGSTVIRVFKREYPTKYIFNPEEIVNDEVDFYAHTALCGNMERFWQKVGKSKNIGDIENIMFRLFDEGNYGHLTKSYNWYVWTINKEYIHIGELTEYYKKHADVGFIFSYNTILSKIKTGKYSFKILE